MTFTQQGFSIHPLAQDQIYSVANTSSPETRPQLAWHTLTDSLGFPLFHVGTAAITVGSLVGGLAALLALFVFSRWLRGWLLAEVFPETHMELSSRQTFATLIRYIVLVFGTMSIFQAIGISLSSFTVLIGALGVGIGFGLQNIFSNFISGLIVMFERPIKIGDHISVAGAEGDVIEIGGRATTLITAQHTKIIVPNQALITGNVINWDVAAGKSASIIGLKFSSDPLVFEDKLLRAVAAVPCVPTEPEPRLFITNFDNSTFSTELHFWVMGDPSTRTQATNDVMRALHAAIKANGISLAG